jgi:hypothetical protein
MKDLVISMMIEHLEEKATNPYAIGMAAAMKSSGDEPPLEKSTIRKAHKIAKGIEKNEETDLDENAWEEVPMMMRQLQFIAYAAEEIMEYLDMGSDPEEWYQNKLASIHDQMQTLHAYAEGEKRMMSKMNYEEVEQIDELDKKTLGSYVKKSADDLTHIQRDIGHTSDMKSPEYKKLNKMRLNRKTGINRAVNRLTK